MLTQSFQAVHSSELNAVVNYINGEDAHLPSLREFHYVENERGLHKAIMGPMAKWSYFGRTLEVFTKDQCQEPLGMLVTSDYVLRVTEIY